MNPIKTLDPASVAGLVACLLQGLDWKQHEIDKMEYEVSRDLGEAPTLTEAGDYTVAAMDMIYRFAKEFQTAFPKGPTENVYKDMPIFKKEEHDSN